MDIFKTLNMIGGLALFLYGMNTMGNSLSKMAGGKLESILEKLTSKKIFALLLGAGVTAIIQSSSATTVMVVGFVNSGIMKLSQAVGIIMGANIGTTVTSWLLSLTGIQGSTLILKLLKPSSFSPVLAGIGIIFHMTSKEGDKKKDVGEILLGFAILMFGMETMSSSVSGLAQNESFTGLLTTFSSNPVLGMSIGAIVTAIIQSSSASVGILQALCNTGAINYGIAIPIIMGQNIGTCVTSIISSIGANKNAKRASAIHLYFNLIGTIIFMVAFYSCNAFIHFDFLIDKTNAAGIALIHTLFNIGATILLYPFSNQLVHLAEVTIRDKEEDTENNPLAIDERFLDFPGFGLELCRQKIQEMALDVQESIFLALENLEECNPKTVKKIYDLESKVDDYEDLLGSYLVKLSSRELSKKDSQDLSLMLHSISDLERISDHAKNLAEASQEIESQKLTLSPFAQKELSVLKRAIRDIVQDTITMFCLEDINGAKHIEPLEEVIDYLSKNIKKNHIARLQSQECSIEMGIVLEDILIDLERISDHCSNIAIELLTIHIGEFYSHEYIEDLKGNQKDEFYNEYHQLKQKYELIS